MVERSKEVGQPLANVDSRFNKRGWGKIVGGILTNAEEAATQLDNTRREFADLVAILADHPQGIWTAADLVELCAKHEVLQLERGEGSIRSQAARIGVIAGRYVAERFELADRRTAIFHRTEDRKGKLYRVEVVEDVPNVCRTSETPNVRLRSAEGVDQGVIWLSPILASASSTAASSSAP